MKDFKVILEEVEEKVANMEMTKYTEEQAKREFLKGNELIKKLEEVFNRKFGIEKIRN